MRVLVVYASRFGSTRGIAERIAEELRRRGLHADLRDVTEDGGMGAHDAVVLGSAVFNGRWMPEADDFVRRNREALTAATVWLFTVGTFGDDKRVIGPLMRREPRNIGELIATLHPRGYRVFAGVIDRHQWPFLSRLFFHALGGRLGDHRDWAAIDAWAAAIARELGRHDA